MTKTFITVITKQGKKEDVLLVEYVPVGFEFVHKVEENEKKVSFPIISVIKEQVAEGENAEIICLRTKDVPAIEANFITFKEQLEANGIRNKIIDIEIEDDQGTKTNISALLRLLDAIKEDSIIYTDITFGNKPMSVILLYAMIFVEKMKDAQVLGIYYGDIKREEKAAKLYDLTALKDLAGIIDSMEQMGIQDIRKALNTMLGL